MNLIKPFIVPLVLLALFGGYNAFYVVDEGEQALLFRLDKPVGTARYAGLHFKYPLIDKVRTFDRRIIKWDGDPNQIPTKDKRFIKVDTTARWKIVDPLKFYIRVNNENGAQSRLDDIIDSAVRNAISGHLLWELVRGKDYKAPLGGRDEATLGTPGGDVGREEIMSGILKEARAGTPEFGIELIDVKIKRINYVETVRQRVYERMISERKKVSSQFRSEGEGEKAEILGQMEKDLKTIRSEAQQRSLELRGEGDAKAASIYAEAYNQDPEFYDFLRTLESYEAVIGDNTRLVISTESPLYRLLNQTD